MRIAILVLSVMSAIGAAHAQSAAPAMGAEPGIMVASEDAASVDARLRQAILEDAQRSFAPECGRVLVPDRAMIPVEFTGGGPTEYAVAFGRVVCVGTGGPGPWQGTGGVMVQFWAAGGGPPRLALEQQMHGFSIEGARLITYQHGGHCPGGAGPDMCRVSYAWNGPDRRFDVTERTLVSTLIEAGSEPRMGHGYEELSR